MAASKFTLASLLIFLLVVGHTFAEANQVVNPTSNSSPVKIDCGGLCKGRCRLSSRPNLCKRACGTCCARCNCVPPGTYGNYDTCPCYAKLTTHGGRRKCP